MVHFLNLPSEIRADILSHVLRYSKPAATDAEIERRIAKSKSGKFDIHYSADPSIHVALLCLINKQIYEEVQAIMNSCRPVEYHLDLVVNRFYVIPEWLYISRPSRFVDVLTCTVRLHSNNEPHWYFFDHADMRASLSSLIKGFCLYGARLRARSQVQNIHKHYAKKLVVDTKSPPTGNGTQRTSRYLPRIIHPKLFDLMKHLVQCDYYTDKYGDQIFTHFGGVEFRSDEFDDSVIDLDVRLVKALERLPFTGLTHSHQWRMYYIVQMWAPLVQRFRKESGMARYADPESLHTIKAALEENRPYYKSWRTCADEVLAARPWLRDDVFAQHTDFTREPLSMT